MKQPLLSLTSMLGHLLLLVTVQSGFGADTTWWDRQSEWHGYTQYHFELADAHGYVVVPTKSRPGKPWVWRARFPGYHAEMDVELVKLGFHIAYIDVAGLFGNETAMKRGDALWTFMTQERKLSPKPVLEGVSRGGLFVYNWANRHPDRIACIYCDTPVCDFKSWPGGKGKGIGSTAAWQQCLRAYKLTEQQALAYNQNPLEQTEAIAKARIPILHVVSENDRVVPPTENTYALKAALRKRGSDMQIISVAEGTAKSNGHHFTHPDPKRVVEFIVQNATRTSR